MIIKFSNAVAFVDGSKVLAWKPHDELARKVKYDRKHHRQFLFEFLWTDIFGVIIGIDAPILLLHT